MAMRNTLMVLLVFICTAGQAQKAPVVESLMKQVQTTWAELPPSIQQAHQWHAAAGRQACDSVQQLITTAYLALAKKANGQSAILNALAGRNDGQGQRLLFPANEKMAAFFVAQHDKMDALERQAGGLEKPFNYKEAYARQGYLAVWDSVYRMRRPALVRYRDGVLKLVAAEMAYLKNNEAMLRSGDQAQMIQYVEAEAKTIQKLLYLNTRLQKAVLTDGVEKVAFCKEHPDSCPSKK